jgi:16S rRNA processing protein RimM
LLLAKPQLEFELSLNSVVESAFNPVASVAAVAAVASVAIPADLVAVGHVMGVYGLQGWVRIRAYSAQADALLNVKTWWLDKPEWHDVICLKVKMHSGDVVAQLQGVVDRDAAQALKGTVISISRSRFPPLDDNEYYWSDLIGLTVINLQGEILGQVLDLIDNGAHPVLRVADSSESAGVQLGVKQVERLIPFVDHYVTQVDLSAKKISVDWGLDY